MGSPKDEPERSEDEDQVEVTLTEGFWLGKYEVTQQQWRSVMQTEPWQSMQRVRVAPDSPACWLSWDQASLFCRELTRQERESGALPEGWEYVLPTEAQWEYACRAGPPASFPSATTTRNCSDYAGTASSSASRRR
jgi:formylglycine-generating enzyme required for sulfatase activity